MNFLTSEQLTDTLSILLHKTLKLGKKLQKLLREWKKKIHSQEQTTSAFELQQPIVNLLYCYLYRIMKGVSSAD